MQVTQPQYTCAPAEAKTLAHLQSPADIASASVGLRTTQMLISSRNIMGVGVHWTELAQDTDEWCALVNTVMNLRPRSKNISSLQVDVLMDLSQN
jgi:hypothetical protein